MYGIERIGVASGRKYFGTTDWYQAGADYLVKHQRADGSWMGDYPGSLAGLPGNTGFALLFLVRGRAPVVMNKLQYEIDTNGDTAIPADWNQRPRDAAHFAKWAAKQSETLLNWQVVDLKAPVEGLHDSPLLYLAGDQKLSFSKPDLAKLQDFIEQGGIIVGNADCANTAFADSFRKLGGKLAERYEFSALPPDSIVFTQEQYHADKWRSKPRIEVLSNGARILMVLLASGDPARYWQSGAVGGHEEAWQAMDDLFLYAVDKKGLRAKGDTYIVTADPRVKASRTIKVARLEYAGNWNPEPGGWRQLGAAMHNKDKIDLTVQTVKLGTGVLDNTCPVAHMTGTVAFHLDDKSQAEIKKFVACGGTLVIDAAGGSGEFADSAEKAMAQIFPEAKMSLVNADNPLYSAPEKISDVVYRNFARKIVGTSHTPRLRAMKIDGRCAVIYSDLDLSVGLVGQEVDGICGYAPASATNLMRDILDYASSAKAAAPTTAPH